MDVFNRRNFLGATAVATAGLRRHPGQAAVSRSMEPANGPVIPVHCRPGQDATDPIQKVLDRLGAVGGGIAQLSAGEFTVGGNLRVPQGVALCGVARGPTSRAATGFPGDHQAGSVRHGTVLRAIGGRGKQDGPPLISLATDSAVTGLAVWYPQQRVSGALLEYPWTLKLNGENVTVQNVELLNSWMGINAIAAHRHLIRNVTGQPLRIGIYVDEIYDIGRIEDVHFNPWWSQSRAVLEFVYRHGESFVFGRSDWEYVFNTFSFGYKIGYRFIEGKTGACNGNFLGIGADGSMHAVRVEQSQAPGLLITNGEFVSFDYLKLGKVTPVQVVILPQNHGPVRFANCSFWGPSDGIARLAGNGTVGFNACTMVQWNPRLAALESDGERLIVSSCEFQQPGVQVRLGTKLRQAVITGNIFNGKSRVENFSKGAVEIGLNSATG